MESINEKITGFRTLLSSWAGAGLASIDIINDLIIQLSTIFMDALSPQGAVGAGAILLTTLKATFLDVIPKLKGTLPKGALVK